MAGHHRDCQRQARQVLGETTFQAAYRRGLGLPADDAVAYALQQPPDKPAAPAGSEAAPLPPRELQVAWLIAAGRSSKEIAAELVISRRIAEGRGERIVSELGFTARARVAGWAAGSQPAGEGR
jgi:non-specific serine/threonine protein kinase